MIHSIDPMEDEMRELVLAEEAIQKILFALEERTNRSVDLVNVDTRNWANLKVEITMTTTTRY